MITRLLATLESGKIVYIYLLLSGKIVYFPRSKIRESRGKIFRDSCINPVDFHLHYFASDRIGLEQKIQFPLIIFGAISGT